MDNVKIINAKVAQDKLDPTRASVTFIVESEDAGDAKDYVISDQILEEGIKLCEKIPLMQVGIDSRGIPAYCDRDGKPVRVDGDTAHTDHDEKQKHYYAATHTYIGVR
jgi:hypothetical protein